MNTQAFFTMLSHMALVGAIYFTAFSALVKIAFVFEWNKPKLPSYLHGRAFNLVLASLFWVLWYHLPLIAQ